MTRKDWKRFMLYAMVAVVGIVILGIIALIIHKVSAVSFTDTKTFHSVEYAKVSATPSQTDGVATTLENVLETTEEATVDEKTKDKVTETVKPEETIIPGQTTIPENTESPEKTEEPVKMNTESPAKKEVVESNEKETESTRTTDTEKVKETEKVTPTTKVTPTPPPKKEKKVTKTLNISTDMSVGTITSNKTINGFTFIPGDSKWTIDTSRVSCGDMRFSLRAKSGGKGNLSRRAISFTTEGKGILTVCARSGGKSYRRLTLNYNGRDIQSVTTVPRDVYTFTFELPSQGTYIIYPPDDNVNIYYLQVVSE